MFISIHIPKTAGTSLAAIFDYGSGRRILYDYKQTLLHDKDPGYEGDIKEIKKHHDFIEHNFDFIHGHFYQNKYSGIFKHAKYITCVRKPVDRLISHYYHVLDEAKVDYWLYRELISGNMDLVDMAKTEAIGDMQSVYLQGRDIADYNHIFINEKLAESIYQFQLLFNFRRSDPWMNLEGEASVPNLNLRASREPDRRILSVEQLSAAENALEKDNELYRLSLLQFRRQAELAERMKGKYHSG